MTARELTLSILQEPLAICKLDADAPIPPWALHGRFFSFTRTPDELAIVCRQKDVPRGTACSTGWRGLKVEGPLDLSLVGILASLAVPLAQVGIGIFALSTYDTDYLLVREKDLERAIQTLAQAGHRVPRPRGG